MEFNIGNIKNVSTNLENQLASLSRAMTGSGWNDEVSASYVTFLSNCRASVDSIKNGVLDIGNAVGSIGGVDPTTIISNAQTACDALNQTK